jgi:hypothetical protein
MVSQNNKTVRSFLTQFPGHDPRPIAKRSKNGFDEYGCFQGSKVRLFGNIADIVILYLLEPAWKFIPASYPENALHQTRQAIDASSTCVP